MAIVAPCSLQARFFIDADVYYYDIP